MVSYSAPMKKKPPSPVKRAIDLAGGPACVAQALGVSPQAIGKWKKRLPAERVLALEELSGFRVSRHDLRPDIYPANDSA